MGRRKLKLEQIEEEKKRICTFKKRKEGLIKKMHELTTLCDVKGCIIAYGPNASTEPSICWPADSDKFQEVINMYKIAKGKDSGVKTSSLADFFSEKIRRTEEEIEIVKKKKLELKYPFYHEVVNSLNEVQSRDFAGFLEHKIESVKSRIDSLKKTRDNSMTMKSDFNDPMEICSINQSINQCQFGEVQKMRQNNSMSNLLMNGDYETDLLCGNEDELYDQFVHLGGGVNPMTYQNVSSCYYEPAGMSLLQPSYMIS